MLITSFMETESGDNHSSIPTSLPNSLTRIHLKIYLFLKYRKN